MSGDKKEQTLPESLIQAKVRHSDAVVRLTIAQNELRNAENVLQKEYDLLSNGKNPEEVKV